MCIRDSYCNYHTDDCVPLSIFAYISLPTLIILYLLRNQSRIQFSVKRINQEERVLSRLIYVKLLGCFVLFLLSFVQLILSFFIKQEEFIIQINYFLNIVFWFFVMFNIQKSFFKRSETSIHVIISMGVNLICQFIFGIMYFSDVEKFIISHTIIALTILQTLLLILTIILCVYQRQDYVLVSDNSYVNADNLDYSITSQENQQKMVQNQSQVNYRETTYQIDDIDILKETGENQNDVLNSNMLRHQQQQLEEQQKKENNDKKKSLIEQFMSDDEKYKKFEKYQPVEKNIASIQINDFQEKQRFEKKTLVYNIQYEQKKETKYAQRSYREFYQLYIYMKQTYPKEPFPLFPQKKMTTQFLKKDDLSDRQSSCLLYTSPSPRDQA
eukprot:TRINITY_DN15016_c0_g1_i2.p1 TRINITY_DN15016_c0_g1~~TRINITY_DN15016_c0_g1_i2.p1  ORF type:complete len:384 (+),score=50.74 TRINITY_DN15016_c0_g1_i2:157-1308(+)